jgi:hypothetical protein
MGFEGKIEKWRRKKDFLELKRVWLTEFGLIHKVQEISGNVKKNSGNEFRTVKLGQTQEERSREG